MVCVVSLAPFLYTFDVWPEKGRQNPDDHFNEGAVVLAKNRLRRVVRAVAPLGLVLRPGQAMPGRAENSGPCTPIGCTVLVQQERFLPIFLACHCDVIMLTSWKLVDLMNGID